MDSSVAIATLQREGAAFAALLTTDALPVEVKSCPGWTVADLARHLGGIHRWARHALLYGPSKVPAGPYEPDAIRPWFAHGVEELTRALGSCGPDHQCWTFGDPPNARFWLRRQAHETTLHRWDAATSLGQSVPLSDSLAVDGIDEVVSMFVPRQVRLNRLAAGPETVNLVCGPGITFTLATRLVETYTTPDATISGTAEAILLLLWKRVGISDSRLRVTGSLTAARQLLSGPLTP